MKFRKISVSFKWYDLWIGGYWDQNNRILYICPLPTCVIEIHFKRSYVKPGFQDWSEEDDYKF